jgi:hypothetical protein
MARPSAAAEAGGARVNSGTIFSGIGHAGLILWVLLGDWLFAPQPNAEIAVTQVSMMTSAEFDAMKAAVSSPPRPQAKPPAKTPAKEVAAPEPLKPDTPDPAPEPKPDPKPAPDPVPAPDPAPLPDPQPEATPTPDPTPQPLDVPEPIAPAAPEEQVLQSPSTVVQPKARPADRVAPDPAPTPDPTVQTSPDPTPATSDIPTPDPVVVPPDTNETVAPETGDVLRTEATQDQPEALGMQTSLRPKSRPAAKPAVEVAADTPSADPAPSDPAQTDADVAAAIAAAVDEAASAPAEASTDTAASPAGGEPMTSGEIGDFSRAIGSKWNLGSASTDALRTTIVIRVTFAQDGKPVDFELIESDGPSEAATTTAFEAARRAIQRASLQGGIPLPPDKYDTWKVLELVFDPNGMRMR